ncbi:MAG TPA: mannose-6-phosphate isomerase, class I [Candidatus Limnocylindrales bacterium]|nr:mannose-6-phosphate isomerase, class I [Candidatus Limnocylindrales bacterium]
MLPLQTIIRGYPWGSHEFIAKVQGRPAPTDEPEAELWIGAHPDSPSTIDSQPLDKLIKASPVRFLGEQAFQRFGPRLPYLMKLLAAQEPLSVQAHPDSAQARAGFMAEEAAGVPKGSTERSYADPFHKPELLVALEDFEALCGFRPLDESAAALAALGVPELDPVVRHLTSGSLRDALGYLLNLKESAVERVAANDPLASRLAGFCPGDPGVMVALLLNHRRLRAGEAVWMPARTLHAYIQGAGVEIMAASDNVLRGGLTRKHVNVPELLRVLRFEPAPIPVVRAEPVADGVVTWPVPVPDFRLFRVTVTDAPVTLDPAGPRTVFCLTGTATVRDNEGGVRVAGGESAFGLAGAGPLTFTADGAPAVLFVASL